MTPWHGSMLETKEEVAIEVGSFTYTGCYAVRAPLQETGGVSVSMPDSGIPVRHPADLFQCLLELLDPQLSINVIYPPFS